MSGLPAAAITAAAITAAAITAAALVLADVEGDDQTYRDLAYDVLTAAAPHITAAATAAERQRIIALASQMRASIPADHPKGAQASFADYLRVTDTP